MKKIVAILFVLMLSVSGMLGGCSQAKNVASNAKEKVLTVGLEQDIGSYEPGNVQGLYKLSFSVYEALVGLDPDFKKAPGLATSWQMSAGGKRWTFSLRKGVKFHDGTAFDAEAVKAMINRNKKLHLPQFGYDLVQSMETPDPYTIVFNLSKPSYVFASDMSMVYNSILAPASFDADEKVVKPLGTGPFKLESWTKGQEVVFVKNDDYWGPKPKIDKLIFKVIPDPQTRVMALENGQIDIMLCSGMAPAQVQELKADKSLTMATNTGTYGSIILFNTYKQPFDDVRVRQAINYALNVKDDVNKLLPGVAVPATQVFAPAFKDFNNPDAVALGYDPNQAKRLLAEAGWQDSDHDGMLDKNGKPLTMSLTYDTTDLTYRLLAAAFQEELKGVGIDVKLNPVQYNDYYDLLPKRNFDLMLTGQWFVPHDEPSRFYANYFTSTGYYSVYQSDTMNQLVNQLDASIDGSERIRLHYALQKEIMGKDLAIFVYEPLNVWAMKNNVQGFQPATGFWNMFEPLVNTSIN